MRQREKTNLEHEADMSRSHAVTQDQTKPRRRRFPVILILFAGMLMVAIGLAWFAPEIVARTSFVQRMVAQNTSDLAGSVSIGRVSLGWMSPVEVRDVAVQDAQGQPLAQIESVRTEKTLFSLAMDTHNLGTLILEKPRLQLLLKPDGSNLEDAIRPLLSKEGQPADIGCAVEVRDGAVEILDQTTGSRWLAEGATAAVQLPRDRAQPLTIGAQFGIHAINEPPAPCKVDLQVQRGASEAAGGGTVAVQTGSLPLRLVGAVAQRFSREFRLDGNLVGGAQARWQAGRIQASCDGLRVERFAMANPAWLGTDVLRLNRVELQGEFTQENQTWTARNAKLVSDVATVELSGSGELPIAGGAQGSGTWLQALMGAQARLNADADLARLANLLPATFRVRESTEISSGRATAELISGSGKDGHTWKGRLLVSNLGAVHEGRRIALDKPVEVVATATQQGSQWNVEQLTCQSSFLKLAARGSLAEGTAQCDGDLGKFVQEVSQFVDLGPLRLSGRLTADASWRSGADGQIAMEGHGVAKSLNVVVPNCRPLQEQDLQLQVIASGRLAAGRLEQLDAGSFELISAGDRLTAELKEPVAISARSVWPLKMHAEGQLQSWLPRVQSVVRLEGWEVSGAANLDIEGRLGQDAVDLALVKLDLRELATSVNGVVIREPAVQVDASASWDRLAGEIRSSSMTIASTVVALRATDIRARIIEGQTSVSGDATYRAELGRIMAWLASAQQKPLPFQLAGEATGRVQLTSTGNVTTGKCTAEIANFAYSASRPAAVASAASGAAPSGGQPLWNEPRLTLVAQGAFDAGKNSLELGEFQVAGEALAAGASGSIREPGGRCFLDLQGNLAYDLQKLVPRLSPAVAAQMQMAGRETKPFRIEGPLFAATLKTPSVPVRPVSASASVNASSLAIQELKAQASVGWETVSVAGLTLGPASVDTQLADGVVSVAPLDLPLSEGKVHLAPKIDLTKDSAVVIQPAGPLVEKVRLTPEMCRSWLKFVAPLIADATSAEGLFSVNLEGAAIPLSNPGMGEVKGVLDVHAASIGPGPLSQQLLTVAEQVRALIQKKAPSTSPNGNNYSLNVPAQQVGFQMIDGRVYHEGLQVKIGDVVVRTKGSVGIDESLNLVAEVPVRDEWVANDRYLSSLRGQVLQLPVEGTLKRPRVDARALAGLTRQAATGAASQLLQQEIGKGFGRLFGNQGQQQTPQTQQPQQTP